MRTKGHFEQSAVIEMSNKNIPLDEHEQQYCSFAYSFDPTMLNDFYTLNAYATVKVVECTVIKLIQFFFFCEKSLK